MTTIIAIELANGRKVCGPGRLRQGQPAMPMSYDEVAASSAENAEFAKFPQARRRRSSRWCATLESLPSIRRSWRRWRHDRLTPALAAHARRHDRHRARDQRRSCWRTGTCGTVARIAVIGDRRVMRARLPRTPGVQPAWRRYPAWPRSTGRATRSRGRPRQHRPGHAAAPRELGRVRPARGRDPAAHDRAGAGRQPRRRLLRAPEQGGPARRRLEVPPTNTRCSRPGTGTRASSAR
jgi:hypothetical protein